MFEQFQTKTATVNTHLREQMVVPDLYVFTLKFHSNFSLYKKDKNMKIRIFPPPKKKKYLYFMQLFSAEAKIFSNFIFF